MVVTTVIIIIIIIIIFIIITVIFAIILLCLKQNYMCGRFSIALYSSKKHSNRWRFAKLIGESKLSGCYDHSWFGSVLVLFRRISKDRSRCPTRWLNWSRSRTLWWSYSSSWSAWWIRRCCKFPCFNSRPTRASITRAILTCRHQTTRTTQHH